MKGRALLVGLAVLVALLAVYPSFGTGYGVRAMLQLFMWVALASSWLHERRRQALGWLATKLLVLYPLGLWLAVSQCYSLIGMLAGFTWVFAIMIVVAAWPGKTPRPDNALVTPRGAGLPSTEPLSGGSPRGAGLPSTETLSGGARV